jgi:hypothetical protein
MVSDLTVHFVGNILDFEIFFAARKGNHNQVRLRQRPRGIHAYGCGLFSAVRKDNDFANKERDEARANFEEELKRVNEDAKRRVEMIAKVSLLSRMHVLKMQECV